MTLLQVGVVSLGCSKNQVDTELMLSILQRAGYGITDNEKQADILIVNTCGFIDPAKEESIDTLLELAEYKKTGRLKLLVATGCLVQRYEKELMTQLPEVDLFLGVSQYPALPDALKKALRGVRASYCATDGSVLEGPRILTSAPYTAYVRIADGCDNRCAYCAIPLIRGSFRSRTMDSVLDEIRALAAQGVKEHILVAQDTSRFGIDREGRSLLPELMERAAEIPGVEWLRVLYCYPDEVDDRLLSAMERHPNICRYLDLPLQHADPALLRRMNRRGDMDKPRELLLNARERGFILRTTCITGFPGETDAQFERLMDFVREIRFDRLGAFAFSAEENTPAAEMDEQVPEDVRQARLDRLMTLQAEISPERGQARIGETVRCLIVSQRDDGIAVARSYAEAPDTDGVILLKNADSIPIGEFVDAVITGADTYDLEGEVR